MKKETINMHILWKMNGLFFEAQSCIAFQKKTLLVKQKLAEKI